MTTINTTPTMPEPLSIYVIHSPEDRRRHAIEVAAYYDYIREEEQRQRTIEQAKIAEANRVLTDDDYYALALKRKAEQDAREAAREAERQAAADAKAAYLASAPDVAVISETSPYLFLQQVALWASRGYTISETADMHVLPTYFCASMNKPEPAAPAAKKVK